MSSAPRIATMTSRSRFVELGGEWASLCNCQGREKLNSRNPVSVMVDSSGRGNGSGNEAVEASNDGYGRKEEVTKGFVTIAHLYDGLWAIAGPIGG